ADPEHGGRVDREVIAAQRIDREGGARAPDAGVDAEVHTHGSSSWRRWVRSSSRRWKIARIFARVAIRSGGSVHRGGASPLAVVGGVVVVGGFIVVVLEGRAVGIAQELVGDGPDRVRERDGGESGGRVRDVLGAEDDVVG